MRVELKPFGIDVVVIVPGVIETNFGKNTTALRGLRPESIYSSISGTIHQISTRGKKTPAEEFCKHTCDYLLSVFYKGFWVKLFGFHPYFYYGKLSTLAIVLKRWLPVWLADSLVMSLSGLDNLKIQND